MIQSLQNNKLSNNVTCDRTNLQQFVSTLETAIDADRSVTEDEADVVVRPNLHPLLYIYCPLQADPQAPTFTELRQLCHLKSTKINCHCNCKMDNMRMQEYGKINSAIMNYKKIMTCFSIISFQFCFVSYAINLSSY